MQGLLDLVDLSSVSISDDERALLIDLEKYVIWAGRYPLPKKPDGLIAIADSWRDYKKRLALWERLYQFLKSIGWITKMDGSIFPTDKPSKECSDKS